MIMGTPRGWAYLLAAVASGVGAAVTSRMDVDSVDCAQQLELDCHPSMSKTTDCFKCARDHAADLKVGAFLLPLTRRNLLCPFQPHTSTPICTPTPLTYRTTRILHRPN
jgi:hypothetical protein